MPHSRRSGARPGSALAIASYVALAACGEGPPTDLPPGGVLGVSEYAPTSDRSVSDNGLVASYDMTTLTANLRLRDFSGRGLHGDIQGTTLVDAPRGGGRLFGAATDRIALPTASDFDLAGPLSVVARFRIDVQERHQHIIACDDRFVLFLTEDDEVRFANTLGDAAVTNDAISGDEWHVVVAIFRGTAGEELNDASGEIWVDGSRKTVRFQNAAGTQPVIWKKGGLRPSDACFIGFEAHGGDASHQNLAFYGVIDEVMVFERALTPQEVGTLSVRP